MAKNTDILKIKNLNVEFPIFGGILQREVSAVHAVKDFNLSIKKGKTIGIVGESGSGKSTLGKAILNVLKLTAPDVRVNGEVLFNHKGTFLDVLSQSKEKTLELQSNNITFKEYSYLLKKSKLLIQLDIGSNYHKNQNIDINLFINMTIKKV